MRTKAMNNSVTLSICLLVSSGYINPGRSESRSDGINHVNSPRYLHSRGFLNEISRSRFARFAS